MCDLLPEISDFVTIWAVKCLSKSEDSISKNLIRTIQHTYLVNIGLSKLHNATGSSPNDFILSSRWSISTQPLFTPNNVTESMLQAYPKSSLKYCFIEAIITVCPS